MKALIVRLNPEDERDVSVRISNLELDLFIEHCPYSIEEGKSYDIELSLDFIDEESYKISDDKEYQIEKLSGRYQYRLVGQLNDGKIYISDNVFIEDDMFEGMTSFNEEYLEIIPDRLSVSFGSVQINVSPL